MSKSDGPLIQPDPIWRVTDGNLMECGYCSDLSLVTVTEYLDRETGVVTSYWSCTWCTKHNSEVRNIDEDGI